MWGWLKGFGGFLKRAFTAASEAGLTDALIAQALLWVKDAQERFDTNQERREWVVAMLVAAKVKESLARLAVELAFQLFKKEQPDS